MQAAIKAALSSTILHYQVEAASLHAHLFSVTLTIAAPSAKQFVSLPVWIPGSYLVREFSKNLQQLQAQQLGHKCAITQQDKCTWQIDCIEGAPLTLRYEVYALDNSVRTAWLDAARGFFNGTSLFLRVHGQEAQPHQVQVLPVAQQPAWQLATGLAPVKVNARGFGLYAAANYDELVDCPVEMGAFWRAEFTACGVPHQLVVAGALPSFDKDRLIADTKKICETEIMFWHGDKASTKTAGKHTPHQRYVFMLNAVDEGFGGLEHRNSTALICGRRDLPRVGEAKTSDGYTTLLGLISHEYFHTWNVKQLRPAELTRYDYRQENYTELLWFFEGFTSYYDDLLLRRAGLLDDASYFKLLNKTINQVMQTPGRLIQSVAQSSMDAWVKYYRQDENTPNATVSYYTKGALVALCLDLSLRSEGSSTLDDVMRALWQRCQGGPMQEADVLAVLQELTGRSWRKEIKAWVHGTAELPLRALLTAQGLVIHDDEAQMAQRLGLRAVDSPTGVHIKTVLRGGAAEQAGLAAGDEWLGVDVGARGQGGSWRLYKLDDLKNLLGTEKRLTAWISRDKRLLRLPLSLPAKAVTWRLAVPAHRKAGLWPAV
jgi:predicted metalloprotease with PDZ domain